MVSWVCRLLRCHLMVNVAAHHLSLPLSLTWGNICCANRTSTPILQRRRWRHTSVEGRCDLCFSQLIVFLLCCQAGLRIFFGKVEAEKRQRACESLFLPSKSVGNIIHWCVFLLLHCQNISRGLLYKHCAALRVMVWIGTHTHYPQPTS